MTTQSSSTGSFEIGRKGKGEINAPWGYLDGGLELADDGCTLLGCEPPSSLWEQKKGEELIVEVFTLVKWPADLHGSAVD